MTKRIGVDLILWALICSNIFFCGHEFELKSALCVAAVVLLTELTQLTPFLYSCIALVLIVLYDPPPSGPLIHLLAAVIFLAWLSPLLRKLPSLLREPLVLFLIFFIGCPALLHFFPNRGLAAALIFLSAVWWNFVFLINDERFAPASVLERIGFLVPFPMLLVWGGIKGHALFLGPRSFMMARKPDSPRVSRPAILRFLALNSLAAGACFLLAILFPEVFKDNPGIAFFSGKLGLGKYLLNGLFHYLAEYAMVFVMINTGVALLLLGGLDYHAANSKNTLKSRNILDFYGNFHHYPKEIYFQLFYFPTLLRLKRIKAVPVRAAISAFIAVGVGSTLYDLDGQYTDIMFSGLFNVLWRSPGHLINACLIAGAVTTSLFRWGRPDSRPRPALPQPVMIGLICLFWILTLFIEGWPERMPLPDIISVYLHSKF
jgi:hypothetical protein